MKDQKVLIAGASIAGLSAAWWLQHIGYQVTVVELAAAPRTNGAAVDLNGDTIEVVKRMGLYEKLRAHQLGVDRIEYKNAADVTEGTIEVPGASEDIEIERKKFVAVMMSSLHGVEFLFGNGIAEMKESDEGMNIVFKTGERRSFDFILGCDGAHSGTRKLWFGPEKAYAHFLGAYFSISIVPKVLVPERTMQNFSVPYKSVMLNAYNSQTDIIFMFLSDEIPYDYRDVAGQRKIIQDRFAGDGWRIDELLAEVAAADFYFDQFCQIRMPVWHKGRVALIGDAAYCPSPAAGQGGSLAMLGAAAIADALKQYDGQYEQAFATYDRNLRPTITAVQAMAEENVKTHFILKTAEDILKRNKEAKPF